MVNVAVSECICRTIQKFRMYFESLAVPKYIVLAAELVICRHIMTSPFSLPFRLSSPPVIEDLTEVHDNSFSEDEVSDAVGWC